MKLEECRVFVCVPAVGKSYLAENDDRFVDMDMMKARYKYAQENFSAKEIEFAKGNRGKAVRGNSIEYIKNQTAKLLKETDKILLFAPNPDVVAKLCEMGVEYCLVFHSKDCLDEIEQRMRDRGNQENFIRAMIDPIDEFYAASISDTRPALKIELHRGEYLSDVFKNINQYSKRAYETKKDK